MNMDRKSKSGDPYFNQASILSLSLPSPALAFFSRNRETWQQFLSLASLLRIPFQRVEAGGLPCRARFAQLGA